MSAAGTADTPPFVSIVVPCRNEARHIAACLASILAADYPPDRLEVLVADGRSDDGTRAVLADVAARDPRVRVIDNPARTTPAALNAGIREARGDVVVRMDAHAEYPPHYVSRLVDWLLRSDADNVGGACVTRPAGAGVLARAIALALAHRFGVGDAHFRLGTAEARWVDTVPFGCWRRALFARVGPFDEELARNQDDEFNHRLRRQGGRVLLVPDVASVYYARGSLRQLARMYHQYGYFKPLVARKVGGVATLRQLAPALLVLALTGGGALAAAGAGALPLALVGGAYGVATVGAAVGLAARHGVRLLPALCVVFPTLHLAYGAGYLHGILRFWVARRPPAADVALSR